MGTKAHQVEISFVWFAVNQDEIGPDVAIAVIGPFTTKRVVGICDGEPHVIGQEVDSFHQSGIQYFPMPPCFFPFIVVFELLGVSNLSH